jgi:hypothetical protein
MELYKPNKEFDFSLLSLESPQSIQGGTHFTKININGDKPLYIQMPKCTTKQGIVKTNRVMYSDLLYNKNNCEPLIEWLLALEKHCQSKINEKKDMWFVSEMTEDDIENMMSPVYRLYRSGKNLLIRTFIDVDKATDKGKCMVYDEKEILLDQSAVVGTNIIPLILIEGIKFTSKSFDIEIKLIQAMVLAKDPEIMQTCLIKRDGVPQTNNVGRNKEDKEINNTESPNELPNDSIETFTDQQISSAVAPAVLPEVAPEAEAPEAEAPVAEADAPVAEADAPVAGETEAHVPVPKSLLTEEDTLDDSNKSILDYEYVQEEKDYLENISNDLEEVDIEPDDRGSISLKQPNEIYAGIYKAARTKAKLMRKAAIAAFLEAKKIKTQHLLDDIYSSDEEDYSSDEELNSF